MVIGPAKKRSEILVDKHLGCTTNHILFSSCLGTRIQESSVCPLDSQRMFLDHFWWSVDIHQMSTKSTNFTDHSSKIPPLNQVFRWESPGMLTVRILALAGPPPRDKAPVVACGDLEGPLGAMSLGHPTWNVSVGCFRNSKDVSLALKWCAHPKMIILWTCLGKWWLTVRFRVSYFQTNPHGTQTRDHPWE